jgi:hypothetical protein
MSIAFIFEANKYFIFANFERNPKFACSVIVINIRNVNDIKPGLDGMRPLEIYHIFVSG